MIDEFLLQRARRRLNKVRHADVRQEMIRIKIMTMSGKERQAEFRKRKQEEGCKRVEVWLTSKSQKVIEKEIKRTGKSRDDTINDLLSKE